MVRANKKIRAKLYITCRTNGHKTKLRQKPYIYRVYIEIVTSSIYVESVLKVYITSYSLLSRFCSFFPERLFFALMLLCLGEVAPIAFLVMFVNQRCRCFFWQPNFVQSEWWMWFWNRNWSHLSLPATLTCYCHTDGFHSRYHVYNCSFFKKPHCVNRNIAPCLHVKG